MGNRKQSRKGAKTFVIMEMNDFGPSGQNDPFLSAPKAKKQFKIYYPVIFWVVFLALTIWCIIDRYYGQLFLMAIKFKPFFLLGKQGIVAPFSMVFFDNFGRVAGRLFLTTLGALFWTQCKTTENFLMEHHPKWVDLGDIRTLQNRIHYILGVFFMGIPMIVHCVLIFLPAFTGVPISVVASVPPAKVNPFIFVNNGAAEIFITHDNIWRCFMAVALFGVLFPFSMSNYGRRKWFNGTMLLHIFCAALFTIDQLRRAPHSQVFNTPVIFYYLMDRVLGLWFYRTGEASIIHKEQLDQDYMILFLYVPAQKRRRFCGSTYYLQMTGLEGALDYAHPYVSFQNHSGEPSLPEWTNRDTSSASHKFYVDRSGGERKFNKRASVRVDKNMSEMEEEEDAMANAVTAQSEDVVFFSNWNTAQVVQLHRWNDGNESFTVKLSRKEVSSRLRFWGPYLSDYAAMTPDGRYLPPIIQIGTGAGIGPLIDFYMAFTAANMELYNPVTVYFSTNSIGLFQFFTDLVCAKSIPNYTVNAHLTKASDFEVNFEADEVDPSQANGRESERDMKLGRLSFMEVLGGAPKDTEVHFCGAPDLQWKVSLACKTYNLTYYPGHRFASDGRISCHRLGPCKFACNCTK